jgi:hypothetical protein
MIIIIEDQARIVKSCVEIGNFNHWCHAASELVDLVTDLAWRDEGYLCQDALSTQDEGLRRILDLNSQLVNFVNYLTFELTHKCLSSPSQLSRHLSTDIPVLTPATPHNNNLLLRDGPNCAELTSFFVCTATIDC